MKLLGAILAGGKAQRFGSDKAHAEFRGRPLVDHVAAALAPYCDDVILCGRPDEGGAPDLPEPGLGPLGGLNGALHAAAERGFARVLIAPCDTPLLPGPLLESLVAGEGSGFVAQLPVLGIWESRLGPLCDSYLAGGSRASMRAWAAHVGARAIDWEFPIPNINSCDDLSGLTGFFP
ncbi:molybdenum cofactor guanylyltransferase [Sphingomonas sp. TDK1]|uniref:molybdenum cofactor guanylyltransferase n=1 Tax=Sphingomonas sp. TDK1 TaxID=453247 RepID=UPI0007D993D2|nr:molybdenum cofactor guanylyltransferase [Sphingomonas sp. TDK1]OAN60176.1 molybdenum cofactor guanylyltransferase [Sphingomonas sp. TDK1]